MDLEQQVSYVLSGAMRLCGCPLLYSCSRCDFRAISSVAINGRGYNSGISFLSLLQENQRSEDPCLHQSLP